MRKSHKILILDLLSKDIVRSIRSIYFGSKQKCFPQWKLSMKTTEFLSIIESPSTSFEVPTIWYFSLQSLQHGACSCLCKGYFVNTRKKHIKEQKALDSYSLKKILPRNTEKKNIFLFSFDESSQFLDFSFLFSKSSTEKRKIWFYYLFSAAEENSSRFCSVLN